MESARTNWRQRIRDAASRAGLPRFWRWWAGELGPLMPAGSRAIVQRRFVRPVIEFEDGEALFWRPEFSSGGARLALVEKVALTGDAAAILSRGRAAAARLAANGSQFAAPRVVVALNPRRVLRKQLVLPAAVEENLAQTLAYDLDRHTPFRPEQLYFDAAIVGRDTAAKTLRVDWVAALTTVVDSAVKQVVEWGAVPVAVVPGPPSALPARLNLLPNAARPRPLDWRRWQVWAPIALVAILALSSIIVPLAQKREYAIVLTEQNAIAAEQAKAADKLRQQLESMQSEYNYVLAKKYAFPSVVHVIDEVTRVLPDDTWLTQFELKTSGRGKETQRDLYLRGESANAGKLIALLQDSKLVEQAAPRSPTTKIQGSTGEIFDLGARLRALPLPPAQALAEGARPSAPVTAPAVATTAAPAPARAATEPAPAAEPEPASDQDAARNARRARRAMQPQTTPAFGPSPNAPAFGPFPNAPAVAPPSSPPATRTVPATAPQRAPATNAPAAAAPAVVTPPPATAPVAVPQPAVPQPAVPPVAAPPGAAPDSPAAPAAPDDSEEN